MKYINCLCEGTLLKYNLEEPLVQGNINVYYLRLDTSNFHKHYNSVWNTAMNIEGMLKRACFTNSKVGFSSVEPLIEKQDGAQTYFECIVPAIQLSQEGRLLIGVEFYLPGEQDGDPDFVYHTARVSYAPKIYPTSDFSQKLKISEDSTLQSLINNLSGGSTNQILIKRSNLLTDFDWVYTTPGSLVYGGLGSFSDEGLKISLSPYAQQILLDNKTIDSLTDTIILDGKAPEKYTGLQFILLGDGELTTKEKVVSLKLGEQLISDGTFWGVIPQVNTTIEDLSLYKFTSQIGANPSLPGYNIQLGQQSAYISLASLGAPDQFTTSTDPTQGLINVRNIVNFSGKLSDFLEEDTLLSWGAIGNSTFLVDEALENFNLPGARGFVEVTKSDRYLLLRWYDLDDGLSYYRLGQIDEDWITDWIQIQSGNGTVQIVSGGTGANDATGARQNLEVYSKEEVNNRIDGLITQSEIDDLFDNIDEPIVYAETVDF